MEAREFSGLNWNTGHGSKNVPQRLWTFKDTIKVKVGVLFSDSWALTAFFSCKENITFLMLNLLKDPGKVNVCK